MFVSAINNFNNKPSEKISFGHSFRVSICIKGEDGQKDIFVNPYSEEKLYGNLNSKLVSFFNSKYFDDLWKSLGLKRRVNSSHLLNSTAKEMVNNLHELDSDYRHFNYVRSVYKRGHLGYIATGLDVPILENIKGAKQVGIAKADSYYTDGHYRNDYARTMAKLYKNNAIKYVENPNNLLRSKNDKEIMLKVIFKKTGKNKSGNDLFELDSYEFHENKSSPTLPPIPPSYYAYKYNDNMHKEIQNVRKNHVENILKRR